MDPYSETILDHGKNPRNSGDLTDYTHQGSEENYWCGDRCQVQLKAKSSKLKTIKHETQGCLICVASASLLSEKLVGKRADEVLKTGVSELLQLLGIELTPTRRQCALVPLLAVKKALEPELRIKN